MTPDVNLVGGEEEEEEEVCVSVLTSDYKIELLFEKKILM